MDEQFNIYWGSYSRSQHSRNIRENGRAFIVIYDSNSPPGTGVGVYIQARCEELLDRGEMRSALTLIEERRHPNGYWTLDEIHDGPIGLYKAVPKNVWMNGAGEEGNTYIDTRMRIG